METIGMVEMYDRAYILNLIIAMLKKCCDYNIDCKPDTIISFNSSNLSQISIDDYIHRINKYDVHLTNNHFVGALIFMERFLVQNLNFISLTHYNVHRVFLLSLVTFHKMYDDIYFNNNYYAQIGGISLKEINDLEIQFLQMISYNLNIDENAFKSFEEIILNYKLD